MSRSPAAILFDLAGNAIDSVLRAAKRRLVVSVESEEERDDVYFASMRHLGITATTFYVLVDLDSADYKHAPGTKAKLVAVRGGGIKSNAGSEWSVRLGTILAIDGTEATIGFSIFATITLRDTSALSSVTDVETLFPVYLDLEVDTGDFTRHTSSTNKETVTTVNTGITLENAAGSQVTPAVGDVLIEAERVSGGGTLGFGYSAAYVVS